MAAAADGVAQLKPHPLACAAPGTVPRRSALGLALQALGLLAGSGAQAADDGVFQTASQAGLPFKYNLKAGDMPGICVEIVQALMLADSELRVMGLERDLPTKRIEADLATGNLDVFFGFIKNPEREALRFVAQPVLFTLRHQVAVRADDPVAVHTLDDIRRLGRAGAIITTQGTAFPAYLEGFEGLTVDATGATPSQNFKMLLAGRGRFVYHADFTLRHHIRAEGLEDKVRILPAVFKVDEQLVAYAPSLSAAKLQRLRKALEQLDKNGELARLRARYGLQ